MSPNRERSDLLARELPLELAFLATEGVSLESLLSTANSDQRQFSLWISY
jgi:hypothetical protein